MSSVVADGVVSDVDDVPETEPASEPESKRSRSDDESSEDEVSMQSGESEGEGEEIEVVDDDDDDDEEERKREQEIAKVLLEEEAEAERKQEEEVQKLKGVKLPEDLSQGFKNAFLAFLKSVPRTHVVFGASKSLTATLTSDGSQACHLLAFTKRVIMGNEVSVLDKHDCKLNIGSWQQLAEIVPPKTVPHFYLFCELLRQIAIVAGGGYVCGDSGSVLYSSTDSLCYEAMFMQRALQRRTVYFSVAKLLDDFAKGLKFPDNVGLLTPRAVVGCRQRLDDVSLDNLVGMVYVFSGFMYSSRFILDGYPIQVMFRSGTAAWFAEALRKFQWVEDVSSKSTDAANIIVTTHKDPEIDNPSFWNALPLWCLVMVFDEKHKITIGFGGMGRLLTPEEE